MNLLINALGDPNFYGDLFDFHKDMANRMHGSMGPVGVQRFLPWHRAYLLKLEWMGQLIDPAFFIPYWNWSTAPLGIPAWLVSFLPTVKAFGPNITVTRSPGSTATLPTAAQVNAIENATGTYTSFTTALETGPHNGVHNWVGGTMGNPMTSPADPLFWMHHAMIDRVWSRWQAIPANAGKNPTLAGLDATMQPWQDTELSLRVIATLGYSYL